MQRQFVDEEVRVRSCRRAADIEPMLGEAPQSVLVLDLGIGPAECLQFLGRLIGRVSSPPIIMVGPGKMAELEWSMRELGALAFLPDSVSGEELARLCRRQWSVTDTAISSVLWCATPTRPGLAQET